ncbi:type II toxin-antitoxin system VapC family toxin [Desertibaculum subflavum]|uniref:type II toxin-antitoxin system VapC family toxin n=1 Tax=Desertibaculum subflavum TaxID=2268458 RepID=UPI000E65F8ED
MSFLLDTSVVSEWAKPRPGLGVIAWLAEFLLGIKRPADGQRRRRLDAWLRDEVPLRFEGRVLPVDPAVANRWGEVVAHREAAGRPIAIMDAFIAATANVHQLKLVTRNAADFKSAVKKILNPWTGS